MAWAFLTGILALGSGTVLAQQVFTDDVAIENTDPALIFDDSTANDGYEWVIRGRDEFFRVGDDVNSLTWLNFDNASQSTALSRQSTAAGAYSVAIGILSNADDLYTIAAGYDADATGYGAAAFGPGSDTSGDYAASLGYNADADGTNSAAIGLESLVTGTGVGSVALGAYSYATNPNTIILGSAPGVNGASQYHNIGIGTPFPAEAVDVLRSAAAARFQLTSVTNTATEAPQFIQRRARGSAASPSAVLANDNLGLFSFRGFTPSGFGGSRATITAQAAGNFSNSSTPTRLIFAVAPTGGTVPEQVLVIENGQVKVNGQNLNVPDYVFEDDYALMPLEELQAFIDANGHLPGVPSADEVTAGGHDLAGSDMAHLRKIEELTLYTLQQEERLTDQSAELATLKAENRDLREHLAAMQSSLDEVRQLNGLN